MRKKQDKNVVTYNANKNAPSAPEIEVGIISAMLSDADVPSLVFAALNENCFYDLTNRAVFGIIRELYENGKSIDIFIVHDLAKRNGVDIEIKKYNRNVSNLAIQSYVETLLNYSVRFRLIEMANSILQGCYDATKDPLSLLSLVSTTNDEISESLNVKNDLSIVSAIDEIYNDLLENNNKFQQVHGVTSGMKGIDDITGGFQKNNLVIIAARPGMGKTALICSMIVEQAIVKKIPIALFSLEMSKSDLLLRLISSYSGVDSQKLKNKTLSEDEFSMFSGACEKIRESPIYISDEAGITISQIESITKTLKRKHDVQVMYLDYIQLITSLTTSKVGNREQEISSYSRRLKILSKELKIPVIALAQLSRAVEVRGGLKKPQLSDLRESGAIEQDADIVSFIYRPEYYGIEETEDGSTTKNVAEFIIAKHRAGKLATIQLKFEGSKTKFSDFDKDENLINEYDNSTTIQSSVIQVSRPNTDNIPF